MVWKKRLFLFVISASAGIIAAKLAAQTGLVTVWLVQAHGYLRGSLDTSIGISGSVPTIIIGFLIGISMTAVPCFLPLINSFLPSVRGKSPGSWYARLISFSIALLLESIGLGIILGWFGSLAWRFLYEFTGSTGKTSLALFGFFGIVMLIFALGDLGFMQPMNWMSGAFHWFERRTARLSGAIKFFMQGLINGGIMGVGCPYPIYQAFFLWITVSGNARLGAIALFAFALGRIIPLVVFAVIDFARQKTTPLIARISALHSAMPLINGCVLSIIGSFMFVFWWMSVSVFVF